MTLLSAIKARLVMFLHAGSGTHHGPGKALENCHWTLICSSIYNILFCMRVSSKRHFKSENVKSQQCSRTSGVSICRGKDLRDSDLTFSRTDSEYILWFELEYQFPTPLALLTLHATSLQLGIFTIRFVEMLVPSFTSKTEA